MSSYLDDPLGRLLAYSMVLLATGLLVWAWLRWCKRSSNSVSLTRRFLAFISLLTLSISAITLALLPDIYYFFAVHLLDPWDGVFIRGIRVGFWCTVIGTPLAFFATGLVRVLLSIAGTLLIGFWIIAGMSV